MQKILKQQLFWVSIFTATLTLFMSLSQSSFSNSQNLYNITRNAAFIALMAIGQSWVLLIGGIDLSVGSIMGLSAMATALSLNLGHNLSIGIGIGLGTALICGLINGLLIAKIKLSPFVVTLGMLSIARSLCLVLSNNQMIYEFGPNEETFLEIGSANFLGMSWILIICLGFTLFSTLVLSLTQIGRHLFAIGGNEDACFRQGVQVKKIKIYAYCFSALCAGAAGILNLSWLGSANSGLGTGYELPVIAATVLGGFSLLGGKGVSWSPLVGAFLIELIRNSLLLLGVDAFWQGTVVGVVLIGAISVEKIFRPAEN